MSVKYNKIHLKYHKVFDHSQLDIFKSYKYGSTYINQEIWHSIKGTDYTVIVTKCAKKTFDQIPNLFMIQVFTKLNA